MLELQGEAVATVKSVTALSHLEHYPTSEFNFSKIKSVT